MWAPAEEYRCGPRQRIQTLEAEREFDLHELAWLNP
jgi:hypothetical protein